MSPDWMKIKRLTRQRVRSYFGFQPPPMGITEGNPLPPGIMGAAHNPSSRFSLLPVPEIPLEYLFILIGEDRLVKRFLVLEE